jgi:hypothetical protein
MSVRQNSLKDSIESICLKIFLNGHRECGLWDREMRRGARDEMFETKSKLIEKSLGFHATEIKSLGGESSKAMEKDADWLVGGRIHLLE